MKKETRDIYIAFNGAEFETKHECEVYEAIAAEKGTIERFLETQQWNPATNKGYAPRTLTTFRNLMERYVEFKLNEKTDTEAEDKAT